MRKLPTLQKPPSLSQVATHHRIKSARAKKFAVASTEPSTITAHEYDPKTKALTVTFHGGRKYQYKNIDAQTAAGFADTPSQGSYLHHHILNKFEVTKL